MDYPELNTLVDWMNNPHENSGFWSPVDWWDQDLPEEMAETIAELCSPELRDELVSLRADLPRVIDQKQQLEDQWGALSKGELCRQLKVDLTVLVHLESSVGTNESPIGTFEDISQLLDFLITLELEE